VTVATTYTITVGLFERDNQPISEDDFFLFIEEEVAPLLKSFSIRDELGYFNGDPEPCRVITYVSTEYEDGIAIHAIATAYKKRFNQMAVMVNSFASVPEFI
jgi:hypothetical protein